MAESTQQLRIVITAQDQASTVLRNLGQSVSRSQAALTGAFAGAAATVAQVAIQKLGEAAQFAGEAIIGFNATLEQSRIGWATMLGGAEQAQIMLHQLQQFAATTPFEFPDVERGARRMVAMGFSAREIIPLLTDIGNAASALGVGTEGVDRITLALGQMSTRTKVSAQDMLQLTEVGIPAWRILAESMGQSVGQVQDAAEKGLIPATRFIDAFRQFSQVNYGGLMERQARTFNGALSNIADGTRLFLSSAAEPLFNGLRDLAVAFSDLLMSDGVRNFARVFRTYYTILGDLVGALGEVANTLRPIAQTLWEGFANTAISALNTLGEAWNSFWTQAIGPAAQTGFQQLLEIARTGWSGFVDITTQALRAVLEVWNGFVGVLLALKLNDIPLPAGLDALAGKFVDIDQVASNFQDTMRTIPGITLQAFESIRKFVSEDVWAEITSAWERAGQSLPTEALATGKAVGDAFGQGIKQTFKPLTDELARLLAQLRAAPVQQALEDTQAAIERDKLLLQIRSLPAEARTQARREIRDLTRNVLPLQELQAFDVNDVVRRAQQRENVANLRYQIGQTAQSLAQQQAAPSVQVPLTVNVQLPDGSIATYTDLLEASGQAQTPSTIQISALRR